MKVTFSFNLPDDQREYEVAKQADNMQSLLWDFSQQLRSYRKYGHSFKTADDALDHIREDFYRLMNNHGVNIDL